MCEQKHLHNINYETNTNKFSMIKKEEKTVETQGVDSARKRTVSLNVDQIKEIIENPKLGSFIIAQIETSEGNLKGNMAFGIAKAMAKQLNIEL